MTGQQLATEVRQTLGDRVDLHQAKPFWWACGPGTSPPGLRARCPETRGRAPYADRPLALRKRRPASPEWICGDFAGANACRQLR
ncbi:hypothetical protein [Streptomyces sp. LN500]|uniref:hypothetical protein n=1 Tax=Streptomyces sp. LN500 TaxID=3112978 RepID=UPI0037194FF4